MALIAHVHAHYVAYAAFAKPLAFFAPFFPPLLAERLRTPLASRPFGPARNRSPSPFCTRLMRSPTWLAIA